MRIYSSFEHARDRIRDSFLNGPSYEVHPGRWQGVNVADKPEMGMRELLNWSFQVPLREIEDPEHWEKDTGCNMPFAAVHFAERVGGEPTNPGEAWKIWPWGNAASKFLEHNSTQFSHTYQERFWPKYAGQTEYGHLQVRANVKGSVDLTPRPWAWAHRGIRYEYGDLNDLVDHLVDDPLSRQAYLPIWFPEDGTCPGRKPCTLGYHFINRGDYLHTTYYIRSCDFIRHWADDCYLTIRLTLWLLNRLRALDSRWVAVKLGLFTMHVVSLHCFVNDFNQMRSEYLNAGVSS